MCNPMIPSMGLGIHKIPIKKLHVEGTSKINIFDIYLPKRRRVECNFIERIYIKAKPQYLKQKWSQS